MLNYPTINLRVDQLNYRQQRAASNYVKLLETSFQNIFEPCYMEE